MSRTAEEEVTHRILLEVDKGTSCNLRNEDQQEAGEVLRKRRRKKHITQVAMGNIFLRHYEQATGSYVQSVARLYSAGDR